jgi:hypothetical protein
VFELLRHALTLTAAVARFAATAEREVKMLMFGSDLAQVLAPGNWQLAMLGGAVSPRPHVASLDWHGPTRTDLGDLDLDALAADIVERYPDGAYPAVVIGSNHGSAAYLAALLGGVWLPSGIDVTTSDQLNGFDAREILHDTRAVSRRLRTLFPGVAVSQRFPGNRLRVTWGGLPAAYRRFLVERVRPGGPVLVVRDVCPVQVLRDGADGSVQLERDTLDGPVGNREDWRNGIATLARPGFAADALRFARRHKLTGAQLLFIEPHALGRLVADTTRLLLRDTAVPDSWLVVQHGCRVNSWPLAAGAVPYWCADARLSHANSVEGWLAGSDPFRHIDLALEPSTDPHGPGMTTWMSACRFATVSAAVDLHDPPTGSSAVPTSHLAVIETMPFATATAVLGQLAVLANRSGLLLT